MPFLDAYIPEGSLSPDAERELIERISDLLIEHEGVDPSNPKVRKLTWVFVHRPQVYVAGRPPTAPRYRFICQVPEGQYNAERRSAMTAGITEAVADAEAGAWRHPENRVGVFTLEVPDGNWGGAGRTIRLPDIYQFVWPPFPDMEGDPRETAENVLAERRRERAQEILQWAEAPVQ
jgi:phenylpyruvate tautomerase PptA (4-oxalocrotonate tautomerase family)